MKFKEDIRDLKVALLSFIIPLIIIFITVFLYSERLIDLILKINNVDMFSLVTITPMESIQTQINISFMFAIIISMPILIYSIYRFCKPAINKKYIWLTRVYLYSIIVLIFLGFLLGISIFSNYIINSLSYYQMTTTMWSIKSVVGLILTVGLSMALIFQTILFVPFIINLGIVTRKDLIKMSLGIFFLISLLAAFITPPDLISQLVLSVPFYGSFWIGIIISKSQEVKNDWSKRISSSWNNFIINCTFRKESIS